MARGHEDWGLNTGAFGAFDLDTAELAARITNVFSFTRTGKVIFSNTFNGSIDDFTVAKTGGNEDAFIDYNEKYSGLGSLRLELNPPNAEEITLSKRFATILTPRFGIETLCSIGSGTPVFGLRIAFRDSDNDAYGEIQLDTENNEVTYLSSGGIREQIHGFSQSGLSAKDFFLLKLVINREDVEYDRVIFNGTTFDLSGNSLRLVSGLTGVLSTQIQVQGLNNTLSLARLYVDNLIFTIDEP